MSAPTKRRFKISPDEHYLQFLRVVSEGIHGGRIRYKDDIVDGLENAPKAFLDMIDGRNFGKTIVRVAL